MILVTAQRGGHCLNGARFLKSWSPFPKEENHTLIRNTYSGLNLSEKFFHTWAIIHLGIYLFQQFNSVGEIGKGLRTKTTDIPPILDTENWTCFTYLILYIDIIFLFLCLHYFSGSCFPQQALRVHHRTSQKKVSNGRHQQAVCALQFFEARASKPVPYCFHQSWPSYLISTRF